MTKPEREKLRELAGKATPGPWATQSNCDYRIASDTHVICEASPKADFSHGMTMCVRNISFITAANPEAILSLLTHCDLQDARIAELEAENAKLAEDAWKYRELSK